MTRTQLFNPENGDRQAVPNVAFLITDGQSSHTDPDARDNNGQPYKVTYAFAICASHNLESKQDPVPQATLLKEQGTEVYVIGVTSATNPQELAAISSDPQQVNVTWWNAPFFNELDKFVNSLLSETCETVCTDTPKIARRWTKRINCIYSDVDF